MKNNLNQLLMVNKQMKNEINDDNGTLNIHHNIIENIVNEITNGIKHTNTGNHLMDVLKIIFYTLSWMECYYFKMMNVLSIVFCVMMGCELTQKYVWQEECSQRETRNAKMQEKCKDNQNNANYRNNVKSAMYFNQCVLKYDSINTLFNGLNIFLISLECFKSDIISTNVQWSNIFRINRDDAAECVDVNLDRILSGNTDVVVLKLLSIQVLAFRTTASKYLFMTKCESFFELSLLFIPLLLLNYLTQLFIELLLIGTIVIIPVIEKIWFLYPPYALSVQIVDIIDRIISDVTHNIMVES